MNGQDSNLGQVYEKINGLDHRLVALEAKSSERHINSNSRLTSIEDKIDIIMDKFNCIDSIIAMKVLKTTGWAVSVMSVVGGVIFVVTQRLFGL